jgi:hypothetical protein
MAIRHDDGQFALDCWVDPDREDIEATTDYSNVLSELRAHADKLLAAGNYKYLILSRWNADSEQWVELETYTA